MFLYGKKYKYLMEKINPGLHQYIGKQSSRTKCCLDYLLK